MKLGKEGKERKVWWKRKKGRVKRKRRKQEIEELKGKEDEAKERIKQMRMGRMKETYMERRKQKT